jgi:hypothetical protein
VSKPEYAFAKLFPIAKLFFFRDKRPPWICWKKARRQGHHLDILAKPMKPEQLITVIRAASRNRA